MVHPYNIGGAGLRQVATIGAVAFDTQGADAGVEGFKIPKGVVVTDLHAVVKTAFNGGTNEVKVGTTNTGDELMAAADTDAGTAGVKHKRDIWFEAAQDTRVYISYAQTGAAATAGEAEVIAEFFRLSDAG